MLKLNYFFLPHKPLCYKYYRGQIKVISYFDFFVSAELAFCGEVFDLTFVLQYFRFIPEIEEIKFFLQVGYDVFFVFQILGNLGYCLYQFVIFDCLR